MPYIDQDARDRLESNHFHPRTPGELTYLITQSMLNSTGGHADLKAEIHKHVSHYIGVFGHSFGTYNAIMGSLCCAHEEYRRRGGWCATTFKPLKLPEWRLRPVLDYSVEFYDSVVAPYEEKKIDENGDVYA